MKSVASFIGFPAFKSYGVKTSEKANCSALGYLAIFLLDSRSVEAVSPEEVDTWGGSLIFIKLGVLFDDKFIMEILV